MFPAVDVPTGSSPTWWQTISSIPGAVGDTFGLTSRPGAQTVADGARVVGQATADVLHHATEDILQPVATSLMGPLAMIAVAVVGLLILERRLR